MDEAESSRVADRPELRKMLDEAVKRKALIESFIKEIVVIPSDALFKYTVSMLDDSLTPISAAENGTFNVPVLGTVQRSPQKGNRNSRRIHID